MAEIDKSLPNEVRAEIKLPAEEVVEQEEIIEKPPVEVIPEDDGGAIVDFEPGSINIPGTENHFDNLADILPEDISSNEDSIFAVKVVSTRSGKCSSNRAVTAKAVNVGAKVLEDIFA